MTLDTLIRKVEDLPPLPEVVGKLLALCPDPEAPPRDIIKVIELDPALTLKVLKLCNSPFYGLPRMISSLSNAVVYLGTDAVSQYVLAWCLSGFYHRETRGHTLDPDLAWRHAVGVGVSAQVLAESFDPPLISTAFTCGLLHDVGKAILDEFMPEEWALIASLDRPNRGNTFAEAERTALGFDHCQAGAALAEHWNLPEAIVAAIRWHHEPADAPDHKRLASLVHVADIRCTAQEAGALASLTARQFEPVALRTLHAKFGDIQALGPKIDERVRAMIEAFQSA